MSKLAIAALLPILLLGNAGGAFAQDQAEQIEKLQGEISSLQSDRARLLNRIERIKASSKENKSNSEKAAADKQRN